MSHKSSFAIGYYPDASVCRVGDTYYLACSSFQYFPALPIYQSQDLVNWQQIGYGLQQIHVNALLTQLHSKHGVRYPALRYHQGRFYLVATHTEYHQHFLVTADDPAGEWSAPVQIQAGYLRASLVFDEHNRAFCITTEDNIASISEIDLKTGERISDPMNIWREQEGHFLHSPHIHRVDGRYALLGTSDQLGGENYVTLYTSETLLGNYQRDTERSPLIDQNTGMIVAVKNSIDLVETPSGAQIAVYQTAHSKAVQPHLTGLTALASLQGDLPTKQDTSGEEIPDDARDDIVLPELELHWQFIRNTPDETEWSVEERAGWLRLNGSALTLSDTGAPIFIGRRQLHANCKIATMVDFEPQRGQEEAGLTVYVDENHHYEIAITSLAENTRSVIVRRKVGMLAAVVAFENLPAKGLVKLAIRASEWKYAFSYQLMDTPEKELTSGETHYLSQPVTQLESGVYFGLYATGNGRKSTTPAYFDWVDYIPETK